MVFKQAVAESLTQPGGGLDEQGVASPGGFVKELLFLAVGQGFLCAGG